MLFGQRMTYVCDSFLTDDIQGYGSGHRSPHTLNVRPCIGWAHVYDYEVGMMRKKCEALYPYTER